VLDEERLRSERADRKLWKNRVTGLDEFAPPGISGPAHRPERERRNTRQEEEDAEMRLAIEASKHEAEEEQRRRAKNTQTADTDDDLAKAIRLSKEEEAARARQLEEQNAASLFDDAPAPSQPQPTGYNQGYQQQPAVDWFGNPLQQQPQSTGFLNNQYAQPQQTGYPNGYANGFPTQPTGFDQFGAQPFLPQQTAMQPQQTAFQTNNPYGVQQPNDLFGQQQQPQQQQQQPQLQPGTHNPWASQSPAAEPQKPLPTGSNNPFAPKTQQAQPSPFQRTQSAQPSLGTLYEQSATNTFTQPSQSNPITSFQAPQPTFQQQQQQQRPVDQQYAKLNALLASGEGQDTFGNVGDLRIPAQHTAPGTFVNSAGAGLGRLQANQTGNNPFFNHQQFTGAPQVPAQTGPVGGFGGGFGQQNSNPFGARPGGQQGGSLIDL
jgi:epsin